MKPLNLDTIEIHKEISADGDSINFSILLDGVPCPILEITSNLGRHCAEYQLIIKDLELIKETLKIAENLTVENFPTAPGAYKMDLSDANKIILYSLFISSIITYGKCFAQAAGRQVKIPEQKLKKYLGDDLHALHTEILDLRNSWVAHGGKNPMETAKTIFVLDPYKYRDPYFFHNASHMPLPIAHKVKDFIYLTEKPEAMVMEISQTKSEKLFKSQLQQINIDQCYDVATYHLTYHKNFIK